jgi:hypothetical protein
MGEEVVHQPNDKLFRSTFSELQNAAAFFRGYLGADLVAAADWSTLRQQEGRFVDEALAGAESDLLFSVALHGREAFIYILFEHQSREDPWMAFRLLRYMVRIWETQRAAVDGAGEAARLSPIVPVVLAQGNKEWKTSPRFGALFGEGALPVYTPDFAFELIQLVALGYEEMRGAPAGVLTMRALRADALGELLHALVLDEALMLLADREAVEKLLRYISERDVDREEFRTRVRQIRNPNLKDQAMTLAEQLRQEGRQQGRQEGRREGQQEGRQEGGAEEAQRAVLEVLGARFGRVPEGLEEEVRQEKRLAKLRELLREAVVCSTVEAFAASLGE